MAYAVNIADLTKDGILASCLIAPHVQRRHVVKAEGPRVLDGDALVLECGDAQAKAIIAVIRMKWSRNLLRAYTRGAKDGWRRV